MNKAIFLDRDGTINIDKSYVYKREDFLYIEGVIDGLKRLQDMGFLLVIISNQSGIARGYYSEKDFESLTAWMIEDLRQKGINISGVYYCPHLPEGKLKKYAIHCDCRKPKTGLFFRAKEELDIDLDHSFAMGDQLRDLSITENTGVRGIWITDANDEILESSKIRKCSNFSAAVDMVADCNDGQERNLHE